MPVVVMGARGRGALTPFPAVEDPFGWDVASSIEGRSGLGDNKPRSPVLSGDCWTDARGGPCCFRISRCGFRAEVETSFLSLS